MALTKVTAAVIEPTAVTDNISTGSIDSAKIADDAIVTAKIADDAVSYEKIDAEFSTSSSLTAGATVDIDFDAAQVFTKTLTADDTLTFSNVSTGMVKDLVITGDFTLTLPASVKVISGTYDGTVSNLIQIVATNGATEQWASISQEAV